MTLWVTGGLPRIAHRSSGEIACGTCRLLRCRAARVGPAGAPAAGGEGGGATAAEELARSTEAHAGGRGGGTGLGSLLCCASGAISQPVTRISHQYQSVTGGSFRSVSVRISQPVTHGHTEAHAGRGGRGGGRGGGHRLRQPGELVALGVAPHLPPPPPPPVRSSLERRRACRRLGIRLSPLAPTPARFCTQRKILHARGRASVRAIRARPARHRLERR